MRTKKKHVDRRVLWLGMMAAAAVSCSPGGPRRLLDGQRLVEQGRYGEAIPTLKLAATQLGTNALAWNALGLAYHGAGQLTNAADAYQRALRQNQDLVEARFNLGCALLDLGKLEGAKEHLTIYTIRRPAGPEGWVKLGTAQSRGREWVAAERSFTESLRLNPQSAESHNALGLVQLQRNRAAEAAQSFAAALKVQSNYPPALLNLAIVSHQQLNNRRLALQKYREYLAVKPPPANAAAVSNIAAALERELSSPAHPAVTNLPPAPTIPAAKPIATNGVRTQPAPVVPKSEPVTNVAKIPPPVATNPPARTPPPVVTNPPAAPPAKVQLVNVPEPALVKTGEPVERPAPPATMSNSVSKAAVPSPSPGTNDSAETTTAKKNFFQRVNPANLFRRSPSSETNVTQLPPRTIPIHAASTSTVPAGVTLATNPAAGGRRTIPRYAYQSFSPPAAGDRAAAERALAQGLQAQRQQRLREAMSSFSAAAKADPGFFKAQYNLGWAAFELGDLGQALDAYEAALVLEPRSIDARYNFAVTLRQAGYFVDAAGELERALQDYPNETRAHLLLGSLEAEQLGQPSKARVHYLRVLEIEPRHPQATDIRYWLLANPK